MKKNLLSLLAILFCFTATSGTIYWRNDGSCTARDGIVNYVVVAQNFSGHYPPGGSTFDFKAPGSINSCFSIGTTGSQEMTVMIWIGDRPSITPRYIGTYTIVGTNDVVFGYMPTTCGDYTNHSSYVAPISNTSTQPQKAVWRQDGVVKKSVILQPGQSDTYTYTWDSPPDPNLTWGTEKIQTSIFADGAGGYDVTAVGVTNGNSWDVGNPMTGIQTPWSGPFDVVNSNEFKFVYGDMPSFSQTNLISSGVIDWDIASTSAARDDTLKAGFSKLAGQNESIINGLLAVGESSGGGGSTGSIEFPTDFPSMTTSNQLDALTRMLTNGAAYNQTNFIGGLSNQWNEAEVEGKTQGGAVSNLYIPFNGITSWTLPDANDSLFSVTLIPGKPAFDFRPSKYLGAVFAIAKSLISWILVISYAYVLCKDIVAIVKTFGSTNQFHIPNVQGTIFGVGGNWGALLIPVLVIAGLALWAYVLAKLGVGLSAFLTGDVTTALFTNPFGGVTGAIAAGIGESTLFFPWSLFFGLAGAYLAWDLTIGFTAAFITVAIRFFIA